MKRCKVLTVFAMCLALGFSACGGSSNVAKEEKAAEQNVQQSDVGIEEKATVTSGAGEENRIKVVTGGYQFMLPEHLTPTVNDQGLILTDENMNYQMLVTVREYSFEDRKSDKDSFAENVRAAEYEITKDVEIVTVSGREFAYFNYVDDASNMLLAYSTADEERTFANLVLRYGDMGDEEILTEIAELLATAETTDLPDTTLNDIVEANAKSLNNDSATDVSGYTSSVEETSIMLGETTVTTAVPEAFYIMDFSAEEEDAGIRSFVSSDGNIDATLYGVEESLYDNIEEWVKESINISEDAENIAYSKVQQEQVGDVLVYYQVVSYEEVSEYSGETMTYLALEAVGTLPQGGYLELSAESCGESGLSFEMVKDFFQIK